MEATWGASGSSILGQPPGAFFSAMAAAPTAARKPAMLKKNWSARRPANTCIFRLVLVTPAVWLASPLMYSSPGPQQVTFCAGSNWQMTVYALGAPSPYILDELM